MDLRTLKTPQGPSKDVLRSQRRKKKKNAASFLFEGRCPFLFSYPPSPCPLPPPPKPPHTQTHTHTHTHTHTAKLRLARSSLALERLQAQLLAGLQLLLRNMFGRAGARRKRRRRWTETHPGAVSTLAMGINGASVFGWLSLKESEPRSASRERG